MDQNYPNPQPQYQPPQQPFYQPPTYQPPQQPQYQTQGRPIYQQQVPQPPQPAVQQPAPQQPIAQQPVAQQPVAQLKTNRSLAKLILLSIITCGIYGIVVMSGVSTDINTVATRYDNKKTMHYCLVLFIFSWLTLGILPLVWSHNISNRIGNEMRRRGIPGNFGAKDFWLWGILGSLIIVGPFIYTHKLLSSMNKICADFNMRG